MNYPRVRKLNRWREYDYSANGCYFVTVCSYKKEKLFGNILDAKMVLNDCGLVIHETWLSVSQKYNHITLGDFQIMPNHIHAIVLINSPVVTTHELSLPQNRKQMLLSKAIGYFKMNSAKAVNAMLGTVGAHIWQRSFHDRVIRDEREYYRIQNYINLNPANWVNDEYNINNKI